MTVRTIASMLTALVVAGNAIAGPTILGMKGTKIECYKTGELEEKAGPAIDKAGWPRDAFVAEEESEDGVKATINGRECWLERSQLKLDVPTAVECGTTAQRGSRGMGENDKCKNTAEKDRR